jgi:hypothetical protein
MGAAKDLVDKAIKENDVLVFSKSYCPVSCRAERGKWRPVGGCVEGGSVVHSGAIEAHRSR